MSYDFFVWEGPLPASDDEAVKTCRAAMDRMEHEPPSECIRAFVADLLEKWPEPDLDDDDADDDDSPWAAGPLIDEACGPSIYFGVLWSRVEECSEFISETAAKHGLVYFDPQRSRIVTRPGA